MTTPEREVLAFIKQHQPAPKGVIKKCFPQWDTASILAQLESAGLVSYELRLTIGGEHPFYTLPVLTETQSTQKETPRQSAHTD